ncbi:hypothetical protein D9M70_537010 [compost metagenome]
MDEVEVNVVETQCQQTVLESPVSVSLLSVPEFRGDEQFFARDSGGGNSGTDTGFVAVGRGGVDVPVAGLECVFDDPLGFLRRDLEDAETQLRDADAVIQCEVWNLGHVGSP